MPLYICCKCYFRFVRKGSADLCPDCAGVNIRLATDEEVAEYERDKAESE